MAIYAVGDVQGCLKPLKCLLREVDFSWKQDQLWLVGDVVSRGPDSLKTLRYLYKHRRQLTCVLGNHDLNLLAVASGLRPGSSADMLDDLLVADDRDTLLHWLRHRPLLHTHAGHTLVHAGIPPMWSLDQARGYAEEVESALRGPQWRKFLLNMYGNTPARWKESLTGYDRLRTITNYFTRMRFLEADGSLDLVNKGALPSPGYKLKPWFADKKRATRGDKLIFGHWASLEGRAGGKNLFALDTGCVWGRHLTLYCLDSGELTRCRCQDQSR